MVEPLPKPVKAGGEDPSPSGDRYFDATKETSGQNQKSQSQKAMKQGKAKAKLPARIRPNLKDGKPLKDCVTLEELLRWCECHAFNNQNLLEHYAFHLRNAKTREELRLIRDSIDTIGPILAENSHQWSLKQKELKALFVQLVRITHSAAELESQVTEEVEPLSETETSAPEEPSKTGSKRVKRTPKGG